MAMSSRDAREQRPIPATLEEAQDSVRALDKKLSGNLQQALMSDTLPILAKHNRETAMRMMCPHVPLTEGAKVCVEAWGTVCRTTPDGEAFILLDSDSHRGLIVAPKDTELTPMAHETLTEDRFRKMRSKAQAIMEAAQVVGGNSETETRPESRGKISKSQERGARVPRVISAATAAVRKGVIHADEGEVESGESGLERGPERGPERVPASAPKKRKPKKYPRRS